MLYHTGVSIQQADFDEKDQASAAIEELEKVLMYFDDHAGHEDRFVLPFIQKHNASLVEDFEKEHEEDHALTKNICACVAEWKIAADPAELSRLGKNIFYHFNAFIAFNLYHMNKEEKILNPVLWNHYSDTEITDIERILIRSIPLDKLWEQSRWMMRSVNNAEVVAWLFGIKNNASSEIFHSFMQMASQEIPKHRWKMVQAALTEGMMLA